MFVISDHTWRLRERTPLTWALDCLSSLPVVISPVERDHFRCASEPGADIVVRLEEAHIRDSFPRT